MSVEAAEKQLKDAVEALNVARAQDAGEAPGVVSEYTLIYAVKRFDDDGDVTTRIAWSFSEAGAWHQSVGLVKYALWRWKRIIDAAEEEGDD